MIDRVTKLDEAESFASFEAIAASLQLYIDGARAGDSARVRRAFLDDAHIRGTYSGKPVEWTLSEFCALIDERGPVADLEARIVAIDHAGGAAMARLEAQNWGETRYTDFFVLLKTGGEWRIASKAFFAHSRA
jgi:hypothetical protein